MTVSVYDAFIGDLSLRQCTSSQYSPAGTAVVGRVSGGLNPSFISGGQAQPKAVFASADLLNLLTNVDLESGLYVDGGTIVIPFQERELGATFAGAGANQSLTAADALAIITSIEASQASDMAMGNLEVNFISADGLTDPVTVNVDQDLSAQAFQALYRMGPVKGRVGADAAVAQIPGVTGFTVNPGLTVSVKSFDGGIWPTVLTINQRDPAIDLTFEDFNSLSRFNATYTSITSLTAYLRKLSDGGTFVADATTGHISFTLTGGLNINQSFGAQQNADGSITQRYFGKSLAKSLTAAIAL